MEEEKKQEIRQKMNTVSKDAKKIRETLCGVYFVESNHFRIPDECDIFCPFYNTQHDGKKDFCEKKIAEHLAVDYLKTLV